MAADTGDGWGIYELSASDFPSVAKQIKQNIRDLSNAERYILATQRHSVEAESDDFGDDYKLPCTSSDAEVEVQSVAGVSDASAAGQQDASSLVENTVHKLPDGAVVTEVHQPFSEVHPASEAVGNGPCTAIAMEVDGSISEEDDSETKKERDLIPQQEDGSGQVDSLIEQEPYAEDATPADPQHRYSEELRTRTLDTPVDPPADEQQATATKAVVSTEAVANHSEHNTANSASAIADARHGIADGFIARVQDTLDIAIELNPVDEDTTATSRRNETISVAKKINPANWPLHADIQVTIEEIMKPTKLPDDTNNCSLGCPVACKGKARDVCYTCDKRKGIVLRRGAKSVLQWWTGGLTTPWQLLCLLVRFLLYGFLVVVVFTKFLISALQGEYVALEALSFVLSLFGFLASLFCAVVFYMWHGREVQIMMHKAGTCIALAAYNKCCCCTTFTHLQRLKARDNEERHSRNKATEKYVIVKEAETFKPPKNCCEKFKAFIGISFEMWLTIFDDLILTVVFILSLYSFLGKQEFTLFHGSVNASYLFGFFTLMLSALSHIFITHGLRFINILVNVRALDKEVERDSKVMKLERTNKFIRYFLSFQSRLVFHVVASSAFQLYGIFALSWKIIQDSCSAVAAPSPAEAAGSTGAPFSCSLHPMVNGFTIYNILYIVIAPTLLGYTSFFVCNTPWLVEYLQIVTMWTYLRIEYMTGVRTREGDEDGEEGEDVIDGRNSGHISPRMQLLKIFCDNLSSPDDKLDEKVGEACKNAERLRKTVQNDYDQQSKTFGTNTLSRAVMKSLNAVLFLPAAIISVLQVTLFIVYLSFLGCSTCFSSDVHAVLSSSLASDGAALYFPLIVLFLLTSAPGPWMGLFWIFVVVGTVATVAALVASVVAVVALVVLVVVVIVCFVGAGSSKK